MRIHAMESPYPIGKFETHFIFLSMHFSPDTLLSNKVAYFKGFGSDSFFAIIKGEVVGVA